MRIVGIDPGLATIGLGLVEMTSAGNPKALEWLTIETVSGLPTPDRLAEIRSDLLQYLRQTQPDLAVVERLYFAVNEKTAIDVAQARGVILATLAECGIRILEPSPSELKLALTGDGRADKAQIQSMLKTLFTLTSVPHPDDAADALALAAFGAFQHRKMLIA